MIKRTLIFFCLVIVGLDASAQAVDYKQFYFSGKNFFREGKYNLAMENFKKAIPYDQNNPFSEYASFYYAISAYNQGFLAVSRDMLNQLKSLYPKWDKMDEVNFWLAKIHLETKDYFQGLKILNTISDKKFQPDIAALKQKNAEGSAGCRNASHDERGVSQRGGHCTSLCKKLGQKSNRCRRPRIP